MFIVTFITLLSVSSALININHSRNNHLMSSCQVTRFMCTNTEITTTPIKSVQGEEIFVYDDEDDEKLIERLNEEIKAESGVDLDQLINPSKVVNLERELVQLTKQKSFVIDTVELQKINDNIKKKKSVLEIERKSVMTGWLKNLFVFQSVIAMVISLGMVYNAIPGVDFDLSVQVLGFWMWWLFIIPSLRARKPSKEEKDALNLAFLISPVVSLTLPVFTKDVALIWWVNAFSLLGSYTYAYSFKSTAPGDNNSEKKKKVVLPKFFSQVITALDYGSGQERGLRK